VGVGLAGIALGYGMRFGMNDAGVVLLPTLD